MLVLKFHKGQRDVGEKFINNQAGFVDEEMKLERGSKVRQLKTQSRLDSGFIIFYYILLYLQKSKIMKNCVYY